MAPQIENEDLYLKVVAGGSRLAGSIAPSRCSLAQSKRPKADGSLSTSKRSLALIARCLN
jgi:hypothetical protein